jgi:dTDP-4-dehydrorhamnose reductase
MSNPRRVLLTGAGGQLAAELAQAFSAPGYATLALDRKGLDIADAGAVERIVTAYQPHLILNPAAYNRVDDAETSPALAYEVNALGPRLLARAARALDAVMVHYSTDYVFDGAARQPYAEDDTPFPLGAYGVSKLAGEYFVRAEAPRSYVVRVSAVFGIAGRHSRHGNFVERMLSLAASGRHLRVVGDQVLAPTYAPDIARATRALVESECPPGIYHCAGAGSCSFFEYARAIFAEAGVAASLEETTAAAYGAAARRPAYSVLSTATLANRGITPPRHWRDALRDYLRARQST